MLAAILGLRAPYLFASVLLRVTAVVMRPAINNRTISQARAEAD